MIRNLLAGVAAAITLAFTAPAFAGGDYYDYDHGHRWGWHHGYDTRYVHHHVYTAPRYVHVYHVYRPAPRYVHVIGYEHHGYASYRYANPYHYGHYWAAPYYRAYYPVKTVYRRHHHHRHMK
jgi:hypothetical protein